MRADDDALRQELREFILGRLLAREASALADRISSDPHVARVYASLKLLIEMQRDGHPEIDLAQRHKWLRRIWKLGRE